MTKTDRGNNVYVAWSLRLSGILLTLFVLLNIAMFIMYRGRALPHYYLGQANVGGKSFAMLQQVTPVEILPTQLTLHDSDHQTMQTLQELGIGIDARASVRTLQHTRTWIPALSLVLSHHVPLQLTTDQEQFSKTADTLSTILKSPAEGRHIVFSNGAFTTVVGHSGYQLTVAALLPSILAALQNGQTTVNVPTTTIPTPADDPHLASDMQSLKAQLNDKISFIYADHTITPDIATIGSWFVPNGISMTVSQTAVTSYLARVAQQFHLTIANPDDLATAATYAVTQIDAVNFNITAESSNTVIRTYCTAVDDESNAVLAELEGKLAETYNDARGWNNGGKIAFKHVRNGCQYTVWMAAPSQMTTFGTICDNYYNCQVGTNVILNYDRWTGATPPWNKTGDSLNNYHTLMIDHETGHRLGFPDNPTCPGAGQPAPVMMQQSIDLKGCVFNIWPRPAEFAQLDQMLNLPTSTQAQSE